MATYTQRLALVQAAIDGILTGAQSVRHGDRNVTLANLVELPAAGVVCGIHGGSEAAGQVDNAEQVIMPLWWWVLPVLLKRRPDISRSSKF